MDSRKCLIEMGNGIKQWMGRGDGVKENIHVIPSPSRWGRDGAEAAKVVCCRAQTGGAVGERKIDLQLTSLLP